MTCFFYFYCFKFSVVLLSNSKKNVVFLFVIIAVVKQLLLLLLNSMANLTQWMYACTYIRTYVMYVPCNHKYRVGNLEKSSQSIESYNNVINRTNMKIRKICTYFNEYVRMWTDEWKYSEWHLSRRRHRDTMIQWKWKSFECA